MFDVRDPVLWVRILTFTAAALALVPEFFDLTPGWGRVVAFSIALINLALTVFAPQIVSWWTAKRVRTF